MDLRGQCEARLGEWVAMDYPADGDELGEVKISTLIFMQYPEDNQVGDPGADDAILGEESTIISNQQVAKYQPSFTASAPPSSWSTSA